MVVKCAGGPQGGPPCGQLHAATPLTSSPTPPTVLIMCLCTTFISVLLACAGQDQEAASHLHHKVVPPPASAPRTAMNTPLTRS